MDMLKLVRDRFLVENGVLYKSSRLGYSKVSTIRNGKLVSMVAGRFVYAGEIAWALAYNSFPTCPIWHFDGDFLNFSPENLFPRATKKRRWRVTTVRGGYKHPLSTMIYTNLADCRASWDAIVLKDFQLLKSRVLQTEYEIEKMKETSVPLPKTKKQKPYPERGYIWFWHSGRWLKLPLAKHVSDDIHVRAENYLRGKLLDQ